MTAPSGFNLAYLEQRTDWTDELFSLRLSGAPLDFKAGQFTKLALHDDAGQLVSRAYSLVNAPLNNSGTLEFLVVANPQGKLTPDLHKLKEGDQVYVGNTQLMGILFSVQSQNLLRIYGYSRQEQVLALFYHCSMTSTLD